MHGTFTQWYSLRQRPVCLEPVNSYLPFDFHQGTQRVTEDNDWQQKLGPGGFSIPSASAFQVLSSFPVHIGSGQSLPAALHTCVAPGTRLQGDANTSAMGRRSARSARAQAPMSSLHTTMVCSSTVHKSGQAVCYRAGRGRRGQTSVVWFLLPHLPHLDALSCVPCYSPLCQPAAHLPDVCAPPAHSAVSPNSLPSACLAVCLSLHLCIGKTGY